MSLLLGIVWVAGLCTADAASLERPALTVPPAVVTEAMQLAWFKPRKKKPRQAAPTAPASPMVQQPVKRGRKDPKAPARMQWQVRLKGSTEIVTAMDEQTVYAANDKGVVYAFDKRRGQQRWQQRLADSEVLAAVTSPMLPTLFVGTRAGRLIALDKQTGAVQWRLQTGGAIVSAPVLLDGDRLVLSSRDGHVYAISATTGQPLWQADTGFSIDAAPAVYGNTVFVGNNDGWAFALDAATGQIRWKVSVADAPLRASPVADADHVYFGSYIGALFALDHAKGQQRWTYTTGYPIIGAPMLTEGRVCVADTNGTLGCVEPKTGTRLWQAGLDQVVFSAPVLWKHLLLVGTGQGDVTAFPALKSRKHRPLWTLGFKSPIHTRMLVDDTHAFVATRNGSLYALDLTP